MAERRKGEQQPSRSVVLQYDEAKGNEKGLWTYAKYGYSVPRRNGKSEILIIRELWGLQHGERILHTAHRTTTSHNDITRLVGEAV